MISRIVWGLASLRLYPVSNWVIIGYYPVDYSLLYVIALSGQFIFCHYGHK